MSCKDYKRPNKEIEKLKTFIGSKISQLEKLIELDIKESKDSVKKLGVKYPISITHEKGKVLGCYLSLKHIKNLKTTIDNKFAELKN